MSPATARRTATVALALIIAVVVHLLVGGGRLSGEEFLDALLRQGSRGDEVIVWSLRVPRTLVVLAAGALLAQAGWLLQDALGNPLAAPEITGVGPGAAVGVVLGLTLGWTAPSTVLGPTTAAVCGGLLGGVATWLLAGRRRADPLWLALAGVAVAAVAGGVIAVCLTLDAEQLGGVARWLVGSADGRTGAHAVLLWSTAVPATVAAFGLSGALRVMAVGDTGAAAVGLPVTRVRAAAVGLAVVMTSAAVSVVGAVSFVGLAVPHLVRRLTGTDPRRGLPACAAIGALVLVGADGLAQSGTWLLGQTARAAPAGVPLGSVTALAGVVAVLVRVRRIERDA